MTSYNLKNSAVKRILQEAKELAKEQSSEYEAHPLEDNIFEWHFTVIGPKDTDFDGGRYHGRILLPAEYPFKPPHLIFLTPNGRFELSTKVCLSITDHHPEFWQPAWGIRTVLLAVMGFFPTSAQGAIGGLDYPKEERQKLAKLSKTWQCPVCQVKNDDFITESDKQVHHDEPLPAFTFTAVANTPSSSSSVTSDKEPASSSSTKEPPASSASNEPPASSVLNEPPASIDSRPSQPQERTQPPPAWLDGLIGLCITLLLYILYRKYM